MCLALWGEKAIYQFNMRFPEKYIDVKLIGVILYVKSIIDSRFIFVLN